MAAQWKQAWEEEMRRLAELHMQLDGAAQDRKEVRQALAESLAAKAAWERMAAGHAWYAGEPSGDGVCMMSSG